MNQFKTTLGKNFTLHFRQKSFWMNLYVPILSIIMSVYAASNDNSPFLFLLPIFICLSNNGVLRISTTLLVRERSDKFKQLQQLIGLSSNAYYGAWILTFFIMSLCMSFLYIIPFIIFRLNIAGDGSLRIDILIILQILYCLALISFMLFLSSFFKNSQKASEILGLLNVALSFVVLANFIPEPKLTFFGQLPTLFFPQPAFQMALFSKGWLFNQSSYCLNIGIYITCLICQIICYLLGFLYFDQVIGGYKTPLFLCKLCKKDNRTYDDFDEEQNNQEQDQEQQQQQLYKPFLNIQDQQVEIQGQPYIQVENLWKKYDNQNILKQLSLEIYQNEIYCLLGPNGSGKSTLMNILSGIIEKSKGKVNILGQNIENKNFRNQIGICMQKDILYPELTTYEHLQFYSELRNVAQELIGQQINNILQQCQLIGETNIRSCQLSGGNKRKLCLAISLIGNSKVIFLDEPSSGMDVITRQTMWQVIKQIKMDRAIIMTTHHLDEADELATRVGILINGQIVTQGTPDFIKLNFGVGYHLIMDFQDEKQMQLEKPRIQQELQKIDSYTPVIQSGSIQLKSVLPANKVDLFYQVLYYLETQSQCKFSLSLNSLEDSYLAIDYQFGTQNIDLNAQRVFNQKPIINFTSQLKGLTMRKLQILLSSHDKQIKYLLPFPLIYLCIIIGLKSGFFFVFMYLTIKALTSTLYISITLEDKDTKIKQYMYASGVQVTSYWLSNILTDFIPSLIEGLFVGILLGIYNVGHFGFHIFQVILLITIFGISLSCFINFLASLYKSTKGVFMSIPLLNFFIFFLLLFMIISGFTTPGGSIGTGLIAMIMMILSPFMGCYIGFAMSPILLNLGIYGYWSCILYLIIGGIFYLSILINIEKNKYKQIQNDMNDTDAIIDVQDITKTQGMIETVHKLSFQVKKQEIFGLLGPNGAGKSTTFNIISKFDNATSGQVRIKDNISNIGLVPQFCPFNSTLTIYQHLQIYGILKGQQNIEQTIETYLKAVDLYDIRNRQVKYLSGGERRKVQIGIALIGGSNRLLMDEPTTGLDPKSRRIIQQILMSSTINNDASILLTTHSLQEAQNVCNRIGIMINGYMIAQGTLNELRQIFGDQARFSVKCNAGRREQVHQIIQGSLQQQYQISPIYEQRENCLSYQMPANQFKFALLFQFLQVELKQKLQLITEFQIYQPTLEQIFAFFASQQLNLPNINQEFINNEEQNNFGATLRAIMILFCVFW